MSELNQQPEAPEASSAGAILHSERRRQSFSVGDVSRQLKLSVRQVEALEHDEFQLFGGPVFVHGFLRNYAKLLGLDAAPLISAADQKMQSIGMTRKAQAEQAEAAAQEQAAKEEKQKSVVPLFVTAGIVIAAIAVWALLNKPVEVPEDNPSDMVAQTQSGYQGDAADQAALTEPGAEPAAPAPATAPEQEQEQVQPQTPQPATDTAASNAVSPRTVVREGPVGVLQFDFFEESWVEVTDRYGDVIYSDLNPAGVSRRVTGYPPLTVVIGNAQGTVMRYNDETVDLGPHTRVDVARVTVE
ncbi:MAG: helix-turn-helix domain-containing protein [Burkholderiales bacterium]